jgi:4-amino-4-deoxychorismate lyase
MADNDFHIFTSLRYDPSLRDVPEREVEFAGWNFQNKSPLYMLDLHRDRMVRAATYWGWEKAVQVLEGDSGLDRLSDFILNFLISRKDGPLRVKVTVSREGELGCEVSPVPEMGLPNLFPKELPASGPPLPEGSPLRVPVYEVFVDDYKTPRSEYTHFKTTRRAMYDAARQRAGIKLGDTKEVLMVNEGDGSVMEGSTTTPYFWRNGRWVTPPVSSRFSSQNGSGGNDGTTRRWALER